MNFKLRLAIDAAKAVNMPKDTIERAIARAASAGGAGELHEIVYEAFGPGGVGLVIEAVTDNTNRTSGSIKSILTKGGGNLGVPGTVTWQFGRKGVIRIAGVADELMLIEAGAEDIVQEKSRRNTPVSSGCQNKPCPLMTPRAPQ
jgi:transcriptional/translational regulatory protein YebC/TACO1